MEPLDLTAAPPRSPHAQLAGLYMLPRTIDKLRAGLPGGNVGAYKIDGFSRRLLDALGITEDDLRGVVARAANDGEVEAWVIRHSDPSRYAEINASLLSRTVGKARENPDFLHRYPIAAAMKPDAPLFDMLDADDAEAFSGPGG